MLDIIIATAPAPQLVLLLSLLLFVEKDMTLYYMKHAWLGHLGSFIVSRKVNICI